MRQNASYGETGRHSIIGPPPMPPIPKASTNPLGLEAHIRKWDEDKGAYFIVDATQEDVDSHNAKLNKPPD